MDIRWPGGQWLSMASAVVSVDQDLGLGSNNSNGISGRTVMGVQRDLTTIWFCFLWLYWDVEPISPLPWTCMSLSMKR